jgi:hypothetical protein
VIVTVGDVRQSNLAPQHPGPDRGGVRRGAGPSWLSDLGRGLARIFPPRPGRAAEVPVRVIDVRSVPPIQESETRTSQVRSSEWRECI